VLVAAGIFLTRVFGLVRGRVLAHFLGTSDAADAFTAALKIPNFLQNLFGEGVLSASFIPVYAGLLARGEREEARRVAAVVASLLALVTAALVVGGVVATPWLIAAIAPGFTGAKRELTITLVKVLFPGTGLLVLSAWCLGVLNSHRRFLLSYTAPVAWNLAIIAALIWGGERRLGQFEIAEVAAWGSVVGSALQFLVQLPTVLQLLGGLRPALDTTSEHVRTVVRNFLPVFVGRGAVQLSAYVDTILVSLLPTGAPAALAYAQAIYLLPVSLFGMSVSAAELPAMSSAAGDADEVRAYLRARLARALRQIAFFVVPSAVALLALGDVIAGAIYESGEFTRAMSVYVWGILAGSAVGLLASTLGRLYASTYYALKDTRTPLRFAVVRILLTVVLGYAAAIPLPAALGIDPRWGVAGLTASAGVAGWVEFALLRRTLSRRIGSARLGPGYVARLWAAGAAAAAVAWGVKLLLPPVHPIIVALAVLGTYAVGYLGAVALLRVPEASAALARLGGRLGFRRGG
jgi:putative peptidoglycan lipid II flippase